VKCVTKVLHEEEKISAQVKPDQSVLLREKREDVRDT
jgi:hypothetical protein